MNRSLKILMAGLLFLVSSVGVYAEEPVHRTVNYELPDYYPDQFMKKDVIQEVRDRRNRLVMSGIVYQLSPNILIKLLATQFGTKQSLQNGMVLGFNFATVGGQKIITQIWELPDGMAPPQS